jgi:hypothetical protein
VWGSGQGEGGGGAGGALKKAAASEHGGTSVTPGKWARKTTYRGGRLPNVRLLAPRTWTFSESTLPVSQPPSASLPAKSGARLTRALCGEACLAPTIAGDAWDPTRNAHREASQTVAGSPGPSKSRSWLKVKTDHTQRSLPCLGPVARVGKTGTLIYFGRH